MRLVFASDGDNPEQHRAYASDLQLGDYNVEILQTSDNAINLVRIRSPEVVATG